MCQGNKCRLAGGANKVLIIGENVLYVSFINSLTHISDQKLISS